MLDSGSTSPHSPLNLIVAYARDRVIGDGNGMPWHYPADLRHFKQVTMGHALIFGRTTWQGMGRILPGRRCLVISRDPDYHPRAAEAASSLESAIAAARRSDAEPFIAGGAEVYRQALPLVTRLYLTEIDASHPGPVRFPAVNEHAWRETDRRADGLLTFRILERAQ
jgi:dihydrofolate reductase